MTDATTIFMYAEANLIMNLHVLYRLITDFVLALPGTDESIFAHTN